MLDSTRRYQKITKNGDVLEDIVIYGGIVI